MTHAWCSDPSRDEAVRAAEDGRTGPLPTLEETIGAVTKRRLENARGEEMSQQGMRTELVTLEVKHLSTLHADQLGWAVFAQFVLRPGESVRVVEEPVGFVDDRAYADTMACDEERDFANRILAERDAAIRERDAHKEEYYKLRAERITQALTADRFASVVAERDKLRARVAELENASGGGEGEPVEMPSREWFARMVDLDEANISVGGLASRVAELEAASGNSQASLDGSQAASTGGEGEPVAWGVMVGGKIDRTEFADALFVDKATAESWVQTDSLQGAGTIVGLYPPPQPRGWLTEEERGSIQHAATCAKSIWSYSLAQELENILARSSPPEVVLPTVFSISLLGDRLLVEAQVKEALAAAGVNVKEVP